MPLRSTFCLLQKNTTFIATTKEIQDTDLVLAEEFGDKEILTINRPKDLNAVNYEMFEKCAAYINKWQNTKSLILVKGAGEKAFCAGGDLKTISYVAFTDGITMGSGVGYAVHGRFCIATERTIFSKPKSSLGAFPDVGGSYYLSRLQGKFGYYIGMIGYLLKGQDVLHASIATQYCESSKLPEIERTLLALKNPNDVEGVLDHFCPKPKSEFTLSKHLDQINKSFSASSVEEILSNLEKDNSDWAKQTIKNLKNVSPTRLKIIVHQLKLGVNFSLGECLQMEYRMAVRVLEDHDFFEGIRVLINKDKNPKWNPTRIEDVTVQRVLSFFHPLPNNEDLPINVELVSKL